MATRYWQQKYHNKRIRPNPSSMPGEGWRLLIQGWPVITNIVNKIYEHRYASKCKAYWIKKGRIQEDHINEVDWSLYQETIKIMTQSKAQWTIKHFSGFETMNYMLHKFGDRNDPICPICKEIEKHTHIVRCKAPGATQEFKEVTKSLVAWLQGTTSRSKVQAITKILDAYHSRSNTTADERWPEDIQEAFNLQNQMGERALVEGFLHRGWEETK